ncbi:hypothetical protein ACFLVK_01635 [Chloroflexota bacterium]
MSEKKEPKHWWATILIFLVIIFLIYLSVTCEGKSYYYDGEDCREHGTNEIVDMEKCFPQTGIKEY